MNPTKSVLQIPERYELVQNEAVGHGAMGWVYKGWDRRLGRTVALKRLVAQAIGSEASVDVKAALREAKILAQVSHPAILQVFDVIEGQSDAWIVCEWLEGRSLEKLPLPLHPVAVVALGREILSALHAVHSAGVIHRDIKPSNIVLCSTGRVVLIDFGAAYLSGESSGLTMAGTPRYSDAGRLEGSAPSESSDLFSVGLILLELLGGECVLPDLAPLPLYRFLTKSLDERVTALTDGLYPPLVEVVERLLSCSGGKDVAKSKNEAHQLRIDCINSVEKIHHSLLTSSASAFLKEFVYEQNPISKDIERKFAEESQRCRTDASLSPRARARWMSFMLRDDRQFKTKPVGAIVTQSPTRKKHMRLLRRTAVFLAVSFCASGVGFWFAKRETNDGKRPPTTNNIQSTESVKVAAVSPEPVATAAAATPSPAPNQVSPTAAAALTTPNARPSVVATAHSPKPISKKIAEFGFLQISANAWADVYLNDKPMGRLPMANALKLKPGVHKLRLENPMTYPIEFNIRIKAGATLQQRFNLVPKAETAD
jgi:serine/threonine protein kinase